MDQQFDVALISSYGRSHWLASELAEKGLKVALIDVSGTQGRWAPEDWEGPFGFFHATQLSASQTERLFEDDYHDTVDEGLVLWLKEGPYDLKGPISNFWMEKLNITPEVNEYLAGFDQLTAEAKKKLKNQFKKLNFQKSWFLHLAHQMAANVFKENSEAMEYGRPLSVFSPLHIRRVSRRGLEKSLNWCEQKGVTVFRESLISDIRIEGKAIAALEVQGAHSAVLNSKTYVWALSSEESYRLPPKVAGVLYPSGPLESQWSWVRYRVKLNPSPAVNVLPIKFVMIKDTFQLWTHDNLCLVEKTVQEDSFDVWVRIPTQQRFQKHYLEKINAEIITLLKEKIPDSEPENIDMPQDYHYDSAELGPARFPVYEEEELKKLNKRSCDNLYFDSPEQWQGLDWVSQMQHQSKILQGIQTN